MSKKKKIVRSKITCTACGETFGVRPDVFDKRAEKAGGVDELLATYKCRNCRKLDKPAKEAKAKTSSKPKAKKAMVKDLQPEPEVAEFMASAEAPAEATV